MKDDFAESTKIDEQYRIHKKIDGAPDAPDTPDTPEKVQNSPEGPGMAMQAAKAVHRAFRKDSMPNMILVLTLITVIVAGMLAVAHRLAADMIREATDKTAVLSAVFPGIEPSFAEARENLYAARRPDGSLAGCVVLTTADGFAGPIELAVGVDRDGLVTGVIVLSQQETFGFDQDNNFTHEDGSPFFDAFTGRTGPFTVGRNIDAVAGVTVSSVAIARGVTEAAELAGAWLRDETGEGGAG